MLTATLYTQMKDGPTLLVAGELFADGRWHVAVFLHQRPSGHWRVGRETDSETYVLNHVFASVPARAGSHRVATKSQRRELLRQVYEFVDAQTGVQAGVDKHEPSLPRPQAIHKENNAMPIMQCAVYTRYGKGPRCQKQAAIGKDICGTHVFLEAKLGALPRQPVTEIAAPTAVGEAIERATPETATAADFEPTPAPTVEPAAPVESPTKPRKARKVRSDKGKSRAKKS
jgi:hypothetical protein